MRTRVTIAREIRDDLYALEAGVLTQLEAARSYVTRLETARVELGMTGTLGDAAVMRAKDAVAALETVYAELLDHHDEIVMVKEAINLRTTGLGDQRTLTAEMRERAFG